MAKIDILEPIHNGCGTIYYAGFVNGEYVKFLADYKLSRSEIKRKLLDRYNKINNLEEECQYGR